MSVQITEAFKRQYQHNFELIYQQVQALVWAHARQEQQTAEQAARTDLMLTVGMTT